MNRTDNAAAQVAFTAETSREVQKKVNAISD
jgi:hypothetical protein